MKSLARYTPIASAIAALGLALPTAATAQTVGGTVTQADRHYCAKLADLYIYYLGHGFSSPYDDERRGANDAQVAASQCWQGDTVSAIAVLERRLTNAKFTLPKRG